MSGKKDGGKREWLKAPSKRMNEARTNEMRDRSGRRKFLFSWPCVPVLSKSSLSPQMIFRHFLLFAIFHLSTRPWIPSSQHSSPNHLCESLVVKYSAELWSKPASLRNQPEANVTCPSSVFPYFRLACYRLYFRVFMSVLTLTPVISNRINTTNVMLLLNTRLLIIGGSNDRAKVTTRLILPRVSRPVRETAMFISAVLQNHSRIVFVSTRFAIEKTQEQLRFFLAAYSLRLPILYLNNFQNINSKSILRLYSLNVRNI